VGIGPIDNWDPIIEVIVLAVRLGGLVSIVVWVRGNVTGLFGAIE
jgi:hypothetical protein